MHPPSLHCVTQGDGRSGQEGCMSQVLKSSMNKKEQVRGQRSASSEEEGSWTV